MPRKSATLFTTTYLPSTSGHGLPGWPGDAVARELERAARRLVDAAGETSHGG